MAKSKKEKKSPEPYWQDLENWLLMNINRQKDKVFFSITRQYLSR